MLIVYNGLKIKRFGLEIFVTASVLRFVDKCITAPKIHQKMATMPIHMTPPFKARCEQTNQKA